MEDIEHKELFEFLDNKFGRMDRHFDGEKKDLVRSQALYSIVPISLSILAFFSPKHGGYTFVGLYLAFQVCLFVVDYAKPEPDPDPAIWTASENETLYRYYFALKYPHVAKFVSRQLNSFRWIGLVLMAPVLLWSQMWIAAGIIIASFFNPLISSLAVRLDPSHFLGDAVRRGKTEFESDLYKLMHVSGKYDQYLDKPKAAETLGDAFSAHERGDYAAALRIAGKFAEQGSAQARAFLAGMYFEGQGVPTDHKEAARLYNVSAKQGLADAQRKLGDLYYKGQGVPKDRGEAIKWYRKAAEQGDADAQFCLGGIFFDEQAKALLRGGQQDISKSIRWYIVAAEQGHTEAQYSLGVIYSGEMFGALDYVQAYKWLDLAATRFPASNAKGREKSVKGRDSIASMMTPEQIAEAQKLAREWKPAPAGKGDGLASRDTL